MAVIIQLTSYTHKKDKLVCYTLYRSILGGYHSEICFDVRLGGANLQKMRLEQHSESSRLLSEITFLASSYLLKLPRLLCATGIKSSPRDLPKNSSISVAILTASLHYITGERVAQTLARCIGQKFLLSQFFSTFISTKNKR